jgi:hypothetical protein
MSLWNKQINLPNHFKGGKSLFLLLRDESIYKMIQAFPLHNVLYGVLGDANTVVSYPALWIVVRADAL